MGWVVLAQFNSSGNKGKQLKTGGNTTVASRNIVVTGKNKLVTVGNRGKSY